MHTMNIIQISLIEFEKKRKVEEIALNPVFCSFLGIIRQYFLIEKNKLIILHPKIAK